MYKHIALAMLAALGLSACETLPWERQASNQNPPVEFLEDEDYQGYEDLDSPTLRESDSLAPATSRRFDDVPLPADLREDFDQTYVYEDASLQIGRMVYYSKASVIKLAQFYIDECKRMGWQQDSVLSADSSVTLRFSKPGKKLEVSAQAQGVGRSQKLVVHLTPNRSN